ncbi:MAG: protein kinase [Oscillospiraceae bacterium]|nr:protein kinase [Oscillospiraceae bacterium]
MEENEIPPLFTVETCLKEQNGQATYLATQKSDGRRAVLYVSDEKNSGGIRAEYEMLSKLSHPSAPKPLGIWNTGSRVCFAREYFEGEDLRAYFAKCGTMDFESGNLRTYVEKNGTKDIYKITDIMLGLCDALNYLHGRNPAVIHSDVTPGHIIITDSGEIKLIGFGFARCFGPEEDREATLAKARPYAAPEQLRAPQADKRSDIYSLGIIMVYMLTGIPDKKIPDHISPELTAVIAKCVQKNPEERGESVECLKDAIYELRRKIEEHTGIYDYDEETTMTKKELYDPARTLPDYRAPSREKEEYDIRNLCGCKNMILYNHANCPHCGKANEKHEKWGFDEFFYAAVIAGMCAALIFVPRMGFKFTGAAAVCVCLLLPVCIISVAEMAGKALDFTKRKKYRPADCRHEFKETSCWCKKCGALRFEGHEFGEYTHTCRCRRCEYEDHIWETSFGGRTVCKKCGMEKKDDEDDELDD